MTFAAKSRKPWAYIRNEHEDHCLVVAGDVKRTVFFMEEQDSDEDRLLAEFFRQVVADHNTALAAKQSDASATGPNAVSDKPTDTNQKRDR